MVHTSNPSTQEAEEGGISESKASLVPWKDPATRLSLFVFVSWGKVFIAHTILELVGGGVRPGDRDSDVSLGCFLSAVCVLSLCQNSNSE